jgi:acyl-coenzyme A thioesterase PaaI-like protein
VCGEDNPIGLRTRCYKVGDTVQLSWTTRIEHSGWSDVMHGGFIATVLDEVMTWAAILGSNKPCFAADFNVRVLEPLPAGVACIAGARLTRARRRIFDVEGWLQSESGRSYARASGRYMPVPPERAPHLRDEFVTSPECLDLTHIFKPPAP